MFTTQYTHTVLKVATAVGLLQCFKWSIRSHTCTVSIDARGRTVGPVNA